MVFDVKPAIYTFKSRRVVECNIFTLLGRNQNNILPILVRNMKKYLKIKLST